MTRILLACGIAAGPWFLGVALVQGLTREPFDFTRNALSQLSLGELGWIQVSNFVITACLAIAGAAGLRQALKGGPGGTWAPWLVAVFGASFLVSAVFSADPGAGFPDAAHQAAVLSTTGGIHMAGAMVGFLSLCAAFVVTGRHFAAQGERGWAIACRLVPVGVLAGFAGSSATVMAFTAGAGLGLVWLAVVSARVRASVNV
ncbi:DUF998 domain-containing protein [Streptosporangium sp. NPDC000396]|uniref:DUF998 domain-containing protein n=1 Tax=Streptosporangium sp. NPDC000396 TaxID=3366185 RepID=UPI003692E95E